jgi:DNA-binding winged helix-turn-helix (wHTH) protein
MGRPANARFGHFALDPSRRELIREGDPVHLTPKAFDLLSLLVREAPRVVRKDELHRCVWPGTFVSDATVVGVIKEIRQALGDRDPHAPIIRTVHRVGYAFCLGVETGDTRTRDIFHWLVVSGRRIVLQEGENLVGRDPAARVWLDFASVSRAHASLLVSRQGVSVEDRGSKNGTQLDGRPVTGVATLRDGDRLLFGSIEAIYRTSGSGLSTETLGGGRLDADGRRHREGST